MVVVVWQPASWMTGNFESKHAIQARRDEVEGGFFLILVVWRIGLLRN